MILFDVDGTLISDRSQEDDDRLSRRRFQNAICDVTGKEPRVTPWRFAGMVDPQICRMLLAELGLNEQTIEDFLPKVIERMESLYRPMKKTIILNVGVDKLLPILAQSQTHVLGVVTGNVSTICKEKLRAAGIDTYFSEGFYGDGYPDRNHLVEDALQACMSKYHLADRSNTIIVGDTPIDVTAANAANATSVAIASGVYSETELHEAGAEFVFHDLEPSKELLEAFQFAPIKT